jgi:SagB-type dehydrogenase family enzyme
MRHILLILSAILVLGITAMAQDLKPIELPKPDTSGGKPLMEVLKNRQSTREFSTDSITMPVLSNLLWAACGINRPESGKRTAPSAMNWQEIDVYVAMANGLYLYDPAKHILTPILSEDIREKTGMQPFVKEAAINLIYVADYGKLTRGTDEEQALYTGADAAFIAQNVYLFCSSADLATVVRGSVEKTELAKIMKLRPEQNIILAQTIGQPKN